MGNTVVFKPPQYGTLLFHPLLEAFRTAFPPGVINTIYAPGAVVVPRLLASGKVNVLALIGSSKVADHLKKQHPKSHRLRAILGLDAKNAAIVLPDADIELAVKECLLGALSFNGQRCTALKMLIVHRSIVDRFVQRFTEELGKLKVGMPWEAGVSITPLPGLHRTAYMTEALEDAKAKGAEIVNAGGGEFCQTLYYPAVVYPVREGMKLYREEQFGPLVPVMPFDDIETALDYVISSDHGQQVSIFGSDPEQIGALVDPLVNQVCRVNINCQCQRGPDVFPFAGRKDSAEGTLSVADALRAFSIRSMVAAKQTEPSKKLLNAIVQDHKSRFINTGSFLGSERCTDNATPDRRRHSDCPDEPTIRALFDAGADVFRFTSATAASEQHRSRYDIVRRSSRKPGGPSPSCSTSRDLLRVGTFANGSVTLSAGDEFRSTWTPYPAPRSARRCCIPRSSRPSRWVSTCW
jgi:aldehyde dehydrogenase (NAD+)